MPRSRGIGRALRFRLRESPAMPKDVLVSVIKSTTLGAIHLRMLVTVSAPVLHASIVSKSMSTSRCLCSRRLATLFPSRAPRRVAAVRWSGEALDESRMINRPHGDVARSPSTSSQSPTDSLLPWLPSLRDPRQGLFARRRCSAWAGCRQPVGTAFGPRPTSDAEDGGDRAFSLRQDVALLR